MDQVVKCGKIKRLIDVIDKNVMSETLTRVGERANGPDLFRDSTQKDIDDTKRIEITYAPKRGESCCELYLIDGQIYGPCER